MSHRIPLKLSYDDVLITPQRSTVQSRENVCLQSSLFPNLQLDMPIISSNMETVTESDMAQAMCQAGGIGITHRFTETPEEQAKMISNVSGQVGASVGISDQALYNAELYVEAGANFICVDVAHGGLENCVETVDTLTENISVPVMAGNVATYSTANKLVSAGAKAIKVGVGPGSTCETRTQTGVGYPQFSAIQDIARIKRMANKPVSIVADGGITSSGDMAKALFAGADAVMIGGLLAGCYESPGEVITKDGEEYKVVRGMASESVRKSSETFKDENAERFVEGVEGYSQYKGSVEEFIQSFEDGVKSACSYVGAKNLPEAQQNAEFVRVTESTQNRNSSHTITQ